MKARKLLAAAPLVVGALVLGACGGGGSGGGSDQPSSIPSAAAQDINAQDRANLAQGGELRLAVGSLAENWNPLNVNGNELDFTTVRNAVSPALFNYDPKGVPSPNPAFLVSAEATSDSPTVVDYKLNPKAVWGDGSAIDVDDFVATWKACNGENTKFQCVSTQGYDAIASVKAGTDKFNVIVTYKTPYPDWSGTFGVLKAESVKDPATFNTGWSKLNNDWLSGPYKVEKVDEGQKIVTEVPNDKWWGDKPLLDRITLRVVASDATAAAYVNNEIDAFDIGVDADAYTRAKTVADGDVRTAAGPNFRHFTFNTTAGNLKDLKVRQAIVYGLNRTQIGQSDLAGIDYPVQPLNNHVFMSNQEGYADSAKATGLDYDPAKAKALLEGDGYTMGADGYYAKGGKPLTVGFTQIATVTVSANEAKQFQDQMKSIGIKVNIATASVDKWSDQLVAGEFQIFAFSWIGTPYPFTSIKQIYGTKQSSNFAKLSLPEVDALVKKIDVNTDPASRIEQANQADAIIWKNVHTLPLYQRPDNWATKAKLANYGAYGFSSVPWENVGYTK